MPESSNIKNIPFAQPHELSALVDYRDGQVVSRTFAQNKAVSLTLFAFDKDEGLSTHTAAGDAMVLVLDGEADITIGHDRVVVKQGEVVVMPGGVPHSLQADKRFKMLLVVIKGTE